MLARRTQEEISETVDDRIQMSHPATSLYTVISASTGEILRNTTKSPPLSQFAAVGQDACDSSPGDTIAAFTAAGLTRTERGDDGRSD